jgi:bacterial/archaeal transporter family-2 protein
VDKAFLAAVATAVAGAAVALQAPLNSTLGKSVGSLAAVSVNFAVGTVALVLVTVVAADGFSSLGEGRGLPWYYWLGGGLLGAIYVTAVAVAVRDLGASGVTAATIAGQLAAALVIDRMGILGLEETPITAGRLIGVVLLIAGTVLVIR